MAADREAAQTLQAPLTALDAVGDIEADFVLVVRALEAIAATRLASA